MKTTVLVAPVGDHNHRSCDPAEPDDLERHLVQMPRKLKVYQTSQGFYDLAIAAPSMKAALEAWGAGSNWFHQDLAREAVDNEIISAALGKPGKVLRRPVGSTGPFGENSALPTSRV